ncbi:TetR/AcrR family transcriptional regulator [Demequina lutea]|uniref:TetR/AcrR family transcriptional regulator n=1 Tax=Demequina lutea TaxID=431489 RepID=UPI00193104E5|nr:TetR/AcrR family transcriptional regulator [Demequina lutea]
METRRVRDRGRPRSGTTLRPDLSAPEQILDAAAQLFVEGGYSATSTRAIADQVGIRQASLYYHFPSKEHILEALLMRTVSPSIGAARSLQQADADSPARLWALIAYDATQLFQAPHNVGTLYLLPEIRNERFEPFRRERKALRDIYAALIAASIATSVRVDLGPTRGSAEQSSLDYLVDVVFGMVESAIAIRADRAGDDANTLVTTIAQSCLRVLGHTDDPLRTISADGRRILAELTVAQDAAR